jgi:DNA-binding transcriptional ArsR family regulator
MPRMDRDLLDRLKALVDLSRVRIIAALAQRDLSEADVASAAGLSRPSAARHLRRLVEAGLVRATDGRVPRYVLRPDELTGLARRLNELAVDPAVTEAETAGLEGLSVDEAKVIRAFVSDGRLVSIPAQDRKRQVVLRWLLERCFMDDRAYPEKEVNQLLALYHPDVASLRRYLVDGGLMRRDRGIYRRRVPDASQPIEG